MQNTFQERVHQWVVACFGEKIAANRVERNYRFLEESVELVQSLGCTKEQAHSMVDYVYARDIGDPHQEVGGVMVTLAALCEANGLDFNNCAETELERAHMKIDQIREKQKSKPHSGDE